MGIVLQLGVELGERVIVLYDLVDEARGPLLRVQRPPQPERNLARGQSSAHVVGGDVQPDPAVEEAKVVGLLLEGVVAHLGRLGVRLLGREDEDEEVEATRVARVDGQRASHLLLGALELPGLGQAHREVEGVDHVPPVQGDSAFQVPESAAVQLLAPVGDRLLLREHPVSPPEEELGPGLQEVAPETLRHFGGPLHAQVGSLPFSHGKVCGREQGEGVVGELAHALAEDGHCLLGLPVGHQREGKLGPQVRGGRGKAHASLQALHQGGVEVEVSDGEGEEVQDHGGGEQRVDGHLPGVDEGLG